MNQIQLDWSQVNQIIENALREDIGSGDVTTNAISPEDARCRAIIIAKEKGILAGLPIAEVVFRKLDKDTLWNEKKSDGEKIEPNDIIAKISASQRAVLTGERLALNFLQRLSGIATLTNRFVESIDGIPVKILDTRKTMPGLRILDKYAVRVGGGYNHRLGLYDGVLIKDNHIKLAGGITRAVRLIQEGTTGISYALGADPSVYPEVEQPQGIAQTTIKIKIEVEASTVDEVEEALRVGADIIMLDNMPIETIKKAVEVINGRALIEVSGGVTLENVRRIAETGVNFISVGSLTHSTPALDIALYMV
jgi:nicotinate-nucleotide pyrophosphorylase (carboxylating)